MLETLIAAQIALSSASSNIPVQPPLSSSAYEAFFEKTSEFVGENTQECAKFVNRMFLTRFGKLMFGNAWTLQLLPENKEYLNLVWRLKEDQFNRKDLLSLDHYEDRVEHFKELYQELDSEAYPIGVIGFVYQYSFHREEVASHPEWLPQTHVAFIAGRKSFVVQNNSTKTQTLEEIIEAKHGDMHPWEREFIASRLPLETALLPGGQYAYNDYLIEEHFRKPMSGSLLELVLRKHPNNRITSLLRPVSYSQISAELIKELQAQEKTLQNFGKIDFVRGIAFEALQFPQKELWKEFLDKKLGIRFPQNALIVPVPKSSEVVFLSK
ncbi:hypothetical protein K9L27_01410 [Candidatus Gracilibacteria bacterium]|nr:hypothetical protein [Candidatus Gracilibacteria bacterium]